MSRFLNTYLINPLTICYTLVFLLTVLFQFHTLRKSAKWKWWLLHIGELIFVVILVLLRLYYRQAGESVAAAITLVAAIAGTVLLFVTMELDEHFRIKGKEV